MKPAEARIVLDVLLAAWPRTDMPEDTARLWMKVLGEMRYDAATAAAETIVRTDNYFPSISRLRSAVASSDQYREQWFASESCPVCHGSSVLSDDRGRWWLCRCATLERRPVPRNANTKPPAALIDAARQAIPKKANP